MIQSIHMPQLGESVTEGTIEKWLVKPGDAIKKYAPIADVLTDKVSAEIPSSFTGYIKEILVQEGQTVPVGEVICTVEIAGEQQREELPIEQAQKKIEMKQNSSVQRYSPAVLTLAAKHQIDLSQLKGSGAGGRITRKDVLQAAERGIDEKSVISKVQSPVRELVTKQPHLSSDQMQHGDIEIPVTSVRKAIANNMTRSTLEVPHAWMMVEVDVTELVHYRNRLKDEFYKKEGVPLTYFAFFVKAVAQALKEYPMMNSVWAGDSIIQKRDIHLSIAVATDDALFVPVIKHADEKSIKGIAKEIFDLANLTREGKLEREHMTGGTFTVNNTGSFGSIQSMGIINSPQAAILQVESIVNKPVLIQGNMIAPRQIVNLCLSLDHRILDGLICGKFLSRVKDILENADYGKMSVY